MKRQDLRKIFAEANIEVPDEVLSKIITNYHNELDLATEAKEQEVEAKYKDYVSVEDATKLRTDLENSNKKYNDYVASVAARERNSAIESVIKDAKGKNTKAILSLLDDSKISFKDGKLTGLDEQIKALQESDAYLFGASESSTKYSGGKPADNPSNGTPLSMEALRKL